MFKIITDSCSDIDAALAAKVNVQVVPLKVCFGSEEYLDGVEITRPEFYARLKAEPNLPTTSAVNPETFKEVFTAALADNSDEILGIFMGSTLGCTYANAEAARADLPPEFAARIHFYDTLNVTLAICCTVMEAVRLRDLGLSAAEAKDCLEKVRPHLRMYCTVDSLKYLRKGGRLSGVSAVLGTILNFKPIIIVENGTVKTGAKPIGYKRAKRYVLDKLDLEPPDSVRTVVMGHVDNAAMSEEYVAEFNERFKFPGLEVCDVGSIVGTHVGPGSLGIAYYVDCGE